MKSDTGKIQRLAQANEFLRVIASCGRRFFCHEDRVSQLELDERGRVWLIDKFRGSRVYTHYTAGRWRGFSEGGTLRALIIALSRYVCRGEPVGAWFFEKGLYDGNRWGYDPDSMEIVRAAAVPFVRTEKGSEP